MHSTTQINPVEHFERTCAVLAKAHHRRDAGLPVYNWFDHKVQGHMEANSVLPKVPVPPPGGGAALTEHLGEPATRDRALYVHIPFCKRICTFCGFFRKASRDKDLSTYTNAVRAQLMRYADTTWAQVGPPLRAVYFGGGTPTALEGEQLALLARTIGEFYPLADDCEFTVECRFDGLMRDTLEQLRGAGVNRLSFGVQSFNTAVRQGVGRLAGREEVLGALDMARSVGFERMSVDLIYNLPGQTPDTWQQTLADLVRTPVTGASVYSLIPMKNSSLMTQIKAGNVPPLGEVEDEYRYFEAAYDVLSSRDHWQQMSFHHFGDIDKEPNIYNQVRAGSMDTLGVGSGAGGQVGNLAYMNPMDIEKYISLQESSQADMGLMAFEHPHSLTDLTSACALTESQQVDRHTLAEQLPMFTQVLDQLIGLELVDEADGVLRLTKAGSFWGYNITAMVTAALAAATCRDLPKAAFSTGNPHGHVHPHGHAEAKQCTTPLSVSVGA